MQDAVIIRKNNEGFLKLPREVFSDSDDDMCIVKDDNEEGLVTK